MNYELFFIFILAVEPFPSDPLSKWSFSKWLNYDLVDFEMTLLPSEPLRKIHIFQIIDFELTFFQSDQFVKGSFSIISKWTIFRSDPFLEMTLFQCDWFSKRSISMWSIFPEWPIFEMTHFPKWPSFRKIFTYLRIYLK